MFWNGSGLPLLMAGEPPGGGCTPNSIGNFCSAVASDLFAAASPCLCLQPKNSDRASRKTAVDGNLRRTFMHEGLHTVPQESVFGYQFNNSSQYNFNASHDGPYDDAVRKLDE
jgi:hypothetical protein